MVSFLWWEKIAKRLHFGRPTDLSGRISLQRHRLATLIWQDKRPLCLFLGDSQIELGNWYELFSGANALINAGVSMSRVRDVASLIDQGSASKIDTVVLMCGINDLGAGEKPVKVMRDYEQLLDLIAVKIRPRRTIVLSVMPVLISGVNEFRSISLNASVAELNGMLAPMVQSKGAEFLNLTPLVAQGKSINPKFTFDGLHPNSNGYAVIADALARVLRVSPGCSKSNHP